MALGCGKSPESALEIESFGVQKYVERTAYFARAQGDFSNISLKGSEELLSHPSGSCEPLAARTIDNFNTVSTGHECFLYGLRTLY